MKYSDLHGTYMRARTVGTKYKVAGIESFLDMHLQAVVLSQHRLLARSFTPRK